MLDELPNGWVKTTLGEIAEPSRERALPAEVPDMRYVGLGHIEPQTMRLIRHKYAREVRSSSVRFSEGYVLYGRLRPYLNKVWVAEFDGICSAEFIVFPKRKGLNSHFLGFRLNAEDFIKVSGERPRVNFKKLSYFPILLPPIAEQERIVAKLNAAFNRLERAETATRRAQGRLEHYRAAVLQAAVTGELTREWREARRNGDKKANLETGETLLHRLLAARRTCWEENELQRLHANGKEPKDDKWKSRYPAPTRSIITNLPQKPQEWCWTNLSQLKVFSIYGPRYSRNDYANDGVAVLRTSDIDEDGRVSLETCPKLPLPDNEYEKYKVEVGDLLITRTGSIGTIAIFKDLVKAIPGAYLLHYRLSDSAIVKFVYTFFRSPIGQKQLWDKSAGSGRQNLSAPGLESIVIPLPPLAEQNEIVREVERRLSAADQMQTTLEQQLTRVRATRQSLLREAFVGRLIPQNPDDESASLLLERIRAEKAQIKAERKLARQGLRPIKKKRSDIMHDELPSPESLKVAWERIGKKADARLLFDEAGFSTDCVEEFYEALRATPEVRGAFQEAAQRDRQPQKPTKPSKERFSEPKGRFRLVELWLEDFKNLKDYTVRFDPAHGLNVILGWNGTGKSNLFEALVIIFRDLYEWWEKNRWPDKPMNGYRLCYEIDEEIVEAQWLPASMKRPELRKGLITGDVTNKEKLTSIKRGQLPLPHFVFGYYSGPTNRLADHFLPMKQAHYDRLRDTKTDDAKTMAELLEQRRFFCAETHHAKYVLLAFLYKDDPKIREFLKARLRILGFESALFIIRKPYWAKKRSKAMDFWGATGIMRRVMERLARYAIAPMVFKQNVSYGHRSTNEEHLYFFLPDLNSLHSFAAEYQDARTFFLALESIDFSELIHDVKIQVRIKASNTDQVPISFHQLSEGEQQLLMVLGLMRFTKSHQSLVLLDEPDTHLNPHWSVEYLKDLTSVMSEDALDSHEQHSSQILMATHDPLVIASLVKEQIHLLKRDINSLKCYWEQASENPRGLGFTGILTSEMFGFRSDLDSETLGLLDKQVHLVGKKKLNRKEARDLESITQQVEKLGFTSASSDPYYREFIKAIVRRKKVYNLFLKQTRTKSDLNALQRETDEILEEIMAEEAKVK
jgi:restriction endonuclease S subunit/predicted ATPase